MLLKHCRKEESRRALRLRALWPNSVWTGSYRVSERRRESLRRRHAEGQTRHAEGQRQRIEG